MKSVLISIHPKWCNRIIDGDKTIEARKTVPKIETPFKCYIYMTSGGYEYRDPWCTAVMPPNRQMYNGAQKVIGEFVCDKIYCFDNLSNDEWSRLDGGTHNWHKRLITQLALLTEQEVHDYAKGKQLYGWHISELKIYDEPKELNTFKKRERNCWYAELGLAKRDCADCKSPECMVQRPPQSWCYVEEIA